MIPTAQIIRRADADTVPARTVERDYVLAHAVAAISTSAEQEILVFKGGTALRLCHLEEYRYSADLDFSVVDVNTEHRFLLPRWLDLPDVPEVRVYTPLEIAGEKLRCIIQRCQCRDFFDLDMLFSEFDVEPQEEELLFREKAQHRGIDPESFASRLEARIDEYRRRWEIEIAEHVSGSVPHFEELERSVRRHLCRARLV
jgi:predicted nucleotidyltransferase component of viral defense system